MASISTEKTGLDYKIWVSTKSGIKHSPRIKVSILKNDKIKYDQLFTVTIDDNPKIIGSLSKKLSSKQLELIKKFVAINKTSLLQFWEEDITTDKLLDKLLKA